MVDDDPSDDRKAKDLVAAGASAELDAKTQADLARWFGLPSFQQIAEGEVKPKPATADPERTEYEENLARALAAIDKDLVGRLYARGDRFERAGILRLNDELASTLDPSISALDPVLMERVIADPREVEIPEALQAALLECTPQAVLRDLHRPETEFLRELVVDAELEAAMMPVNAVSEARDTMRSSLRLTLDPSPYQQAVAEMEPMVRAKRAPWSEIRTPNRTVVE